MELSVKNAFLTCLNKLAWSQHQSPSSRIIVVYIRSLCSSTQAGHEHRLEELDLKLIKLRKLQSSLISTSSGSFSDRTAEITLLEQEADTLTKEKTLLEKPSDRLLLAEALRVFLSDWQITADPDAFPADFFRNAVARVDVLGRNSVSFSFSCGLIFSESLKRDDNNVRKNSLRISD